MSNLFNSCNFSMLIVYVIYPAHTYGKNRAFEALSLTFIDTDWKAEPHIDLTRHLSPPWLQHPSHPVCPVGSSVALATYLPYLWPNLHHHRPWDPQLCSQVLTEVSDSVLRFVALRYVLRMLCLLLRNLQLLSEHELLASTWSVLLRPPALLFPFHTCFYINWPSQVSDVRS